MTNPDYTHLVVVMDRSGSMDTIRTDMEGAINALFEEQATLPGKCLVDLVQFDDRYDVVFKDREVGLAKATLQPRGLTALVDAIGKTIADVGIKLDRLPEDERPGTVIVAVVTDGMENASQEYTADNVKEMIKHQTDVYGWNFTFLGANMDAVKTGAMYGFDPSQSLTWNPKDVAAAGATVSTYVTNTRSGLANAYSDEDRKANAPGASK
jgi:hypothetical protein